MANLIRRNLDNLLDDPLRSVDDLFRGFFIRPVGMEDAPSISLDLREDDKNYTVHANLPGVKKEDIDVHIETNRVQISAEIRKEREEKEGEKLIRSERYIGKVSRGFSLAQEVDEKQASAKFDNGVLELVLPKKPASTASHKIQIQ